MTTSLTKPLYTARASATGGRSGHGATDDGVGYAACFQSALGVVGRRQDVDTSGSTVEADVTIGTIPGGGYGLAVGLRVTIPGVPPETVQALAEAAHQVCPYSNATRGNIDVTVTAA